MSIFLNTIDETIPQQVGQQAKILTLLLGLTAILLASGFLLGDSANNSNYRILLELFDYKVWSVIWGAYGILKFFQLFEKLPYCVRITTSITGIWLWLYLFLSFIVFDRFDFSPAELLILLPLACEVGELVLEIFKFRLKGPNKRNPSI